MSNSFNDVTTNADEIYIEKCKENKSWQSFSSRLGRLLEHQHADTVPTGFGLNPHWCDALNHQLSILVHSEMCLKKFRASLRLEHLENCREQLRSDFDFFRRWNFSGNQHCLTGLLDGEGFPVLKLYFKSTLPGLLELYNRQTLFCKNESIRAGGNFWAKPVWRFCGVP
nr:hypothetical protein HmN_000113400 [Hymenolepis microstoma]